LSLLLSLSSSLSLKKKKKKKIRDDEYEKSAYVTEEKVLNLTRLFSGRKFLSTNQQRRVNDDDANFRARRKLSDDMQTLSPVSYYYQYYYS